MLKTANELSKSAKALVRSRLHHRGKAPTNERLRSVLPALQSQSASALAQELADLIGVDIECLRIDDRFGDILSVGRGELPEDIQPLLEDFGLTEGVDPFGLDLLDLIEKRVRGDESKLRQLPFVPHPKNEDEWIERIMAMTIRQFLAALI